MERRVGHLYPCPFSKLCHGGSSLVENLKKKDRTAHACRVLPAAISTWYVEYYSVLCSTFLSTLRERVQIFHLFSVESIEGYDFKNKYCILQYSGTNFDVPSVNSCDFITHATGLSRVS